MEVNGLAWTIHCHLASYIMSCTSSTSQSEMRVREKLGVESSVRPQSGFKPSFVRLKLVALLSTAALKLRAVVDIAALMLILSIS